MIIQNGKKNGWIALKNKFTEASARIAAHIHANSEAVNDSYYGKTFSAWLLHAHGYSDWKKPATEWMKNVPSNEFHWEFQNLALIHLYEKTHDADIQHFLLRETRHRHLQHTNWILMRAVFYAKLYHILSPRGLWKRRGIAEVKNALANRKNGFFLDETHTSASLQYHAFSTLLLDMLSRENGFEYLRPDVEKAVQLVDDFVLPHGEANYFGRGQQQLFGATAAMAVLARNGYQKSAERVFQFIQSASPKGIPPLMLLDSPSSTDEKIGWYNYNRLYDYVSFAGIMFMLASNAPHSNPLKKNTQKGDESRFPYLHVLTRGEQKIVVGKPTTPTIFAESLPWPIIGTPKKSYFLAQGGAYSNPNMRYSPGAPFFVTKSNNSFAALDMKTIDSNTNGFFIHSKSDTFNLHRTITWEKNTIKINDIISFNRPVTGTLCAINIPFSDFTRSLNDKPTIEWLKKKGFWIKTTLALKLEEAESASGIGPQLRGHIERAFQANEKIETEYVFTIPMKISPVRKKRYK